MTALAKGEHFQAIAIAIDSNRSYKTVTATNTTHSENSG